VFWYSDLMWTLLLLKIGYKTPQRFRWGSSKMIRYFCLIHLADKLAVCIIFTQSLHSDRQESDCLHPTETRGFLILPINKATGVCVCLQYSSWRLNTSIDLYLMSTTFVNDDTTAINQTLCHGQTQLPDSHLQKTGLVKYKAVTNTLSWLRS
jgi:hypothetical protein